MLLSEICWFEKESIYNLCFAVETCMDHRPGFFFLLLLAVRVSSIHHVALKAILSRNIVLGIWVAVWTQSLNPAR